jgi:hypothetical protein
LRRIESLETPLEPLKSSRLLADARGVRTRGLLRMRRAPEPAMNSRRRISALQGFVGKPIAVRDALEPAIDSGNWPDPEVQALPGDVL